MKTIFKYNLQVGVNELEIPVSSDYLKVDVQRGTICLWALVDPDTALMKSKFIVVGTGWDIDEFANANNDPNISKSVCKNNHLGTVLLEGGYLVFHVFKYHKY